MLVLTRIPGEGIVLTLPATRQDAEQALARGLRFIHEQDARLEELGSA